MACISRITDNSIAQKFGNGYHTFYVEKRCNLPCMANSDICNICVNKLKDYNKQSSRLFDHGKVNEPIPDNSHIFGGKWYELGVKKWGEPCEAAIKFAKQYQQETRRGFVVIQPDTNQNISNDPIKRRKKPVIGTKTITIDDNIINSDNNNTSNSNNKIDETYKDNTQKEELEMPRGKKTDTSNETNNETVIPVKKRGRPKIGTKTTITNSTEALSPQNEEANRAIAEVVSTTPVSAPSVSATSVSATSKPAVRRRKADLIGNTVSSTTTRKKPVTSRKKTISDVVNPLLVDNPIIFQEAVIPTIMENDIEQIDTEGYEIEYIELREFEIIGVSYYRNAKKKKLYKKVKNGIGSYVGRYYQDKDEIDYDIPDSDNEL